MTNPNPTTPAPAMQDFVATELRGIIDVCGDSPTAIVSVERMRLWLSKLRAPVASAEVMDALNWVDDFVARCNRDDRGSCESVNVLRRALASAPVADNWRQYALPGEATAEQVCERLNAEVTRRTVAAMRASSPVADERDAARYRVLRRYTAPLRLAESMGIPRKQVKRSDDPAARVDEMCDAALASAPVAGEAQKPVAVLRFERGTPGKENEMPHVVSCDWLPDGDYSVYAAPQASEAVREQRTGNMDRRAAFEAWWLDNMNVSVFDLARTDYPMTAPDDQQYLCEETNRGWMVWKGCAALSAQPGEQKDGRQ